MTNISDELFIQIFEQGNDIESFFEAIFGFLSRCTNFYEDVKISEQILIDSFRKYDLQNNEQDDLDICFTDNTIDCQDINMIPDNICDVHNIKFNDDTLINSIIHDPIYCNEIEITTTTEMDNEDVIKKDNNKQSLIDTPTNKHSIKASDSYNGAITEKYCWSQTITDVDIQIRLPDNIKTSNQLKIQITPTHLRIDIHSKTYVNEDLCWRCKVSESMWWISNGMLLIHLEKHQERWWEKLLITDDALDIKRMDCSRPLDELSEEAQNLVQEMFWNEQQKRMGKPTSDDIRKNEILRKSWNVDGSPFKGKDFDADLVKFQ